MKNATTQVVYIPIEDRPVSAVPYALYAVTSSGSQGTQGPVGPQSETGNGIASITGPVSDGLNDTYTINYTNGTTSTFVVKNGAPGAAGPAGAAGAAGADGAPGNGIASITGPVTEGLNDTYTINYTNGTTSTFVVKNGPAGQQGTAGADGRGIQCISAPVTSGLTDTYTITYTDGSTSTFTVTNGANGEQGEQGQSLGCPDVKECISDTLSAYTPTNQFCDAVKDCDFSNNSSIAALLQTLSDKIDAQNNKIDSLANLAASQDSTINALNKLVNPFECGTSTVKDIDGNTYNTVKIGNQCWTKENMRCTKEPGGGSIILNADSTSYSTPMAYCGTGDYVSKYGYLYNFAATMNIQGMDTILPYPHQGICPDGWHVPTSEEWETLADFAGVSHGGAWVADGVGLGKLTGGNDWEVSTNYCETAPCNYSYADRNSTGLNVLPAGYSDGRVENVGSDAYYWCSTAMPESPEYGWNENVHSSYCNLMVTTYNRNEAYSVRCLRDVGNGGTAGGNETAGTTPFTPGGDNTCCSELNARLDSLKNVIDSLTNLPHSSDTLTDVQCPQSSTVEDAEGNSYPTVKIGKQCWMAQNLRKKLETGDYGYPTGAGNDTVTYGRLYSRTATMNGGQPSSDVSSHVQGICPDGWHVPSEGEWGNLINYLKSKAEYLCGDGENNIAKALTSETGWSTSDIACAVGNNQTNITKTGFAAVPAGKYFDTVFDKFGYNAYFWSATKINNNVRYYILDCTSPEVGQGFDFSENMGLSVRCLKDSEQ